MGKSICHKWVKFTDLFSDRLAEELVVSLCTSKGDVLDKFVSDIFDVDSKYMNYRSRCI